MSSITTAQLINLRQLLLSRIMRALPSSSDHTPAISLTIHDLAERTSLSARMLRIGLRTLERRQLLVVLRKADAMTGRRYMLLD